MRILHVIGRMGHGGIETWLMNVLRRVDRRKYRFDFLVHTRDSQPHDEEVRHLGARILPGPAPSRPLEYRRNLRRVLRDEGPYDVVHAHGSRFVGFVLHHAAGAGVPVRIAHSHNVLETGRPRLRSRLYGRVNRRRMMRSATVGLGCSSAATAALFGSRWQADRRFGVLCYGLDFAPLRLPDAARRGARQEWAIPAETPVVGNVGRLVLQKNHTFFVQVAAEVTKLRPEVKFLLVGDGVLRGQIERQVGQAGLDGKVIFAGARGDVPALLAAMDLFLFTSRWEGLGLAVVEAQAAGLRCLMGDVIPPEAVVIDEHVTRLPLDAPPVSWAETACRLLDAEPVDRDAAWNRVANSRFALARSAESLINVYETNRPPSPER